MWSAFLTRNDLLKPDNLPESLNNEKLKKAINVLEVMNFTEEERTAYEDRLKWLRIETNTLKKTEEKGIEIGMELGMEKGIELGMEKGIEKKGEELAINMLKKNLDIKLVTEVTGLSILEIQKIKAKL